MTWWLEGCKEQKADPVCVGEYEYLYWRGNGGLVGIGHHGEPGALGSGQVGGQGGAGVGQAAGAGTGHVDGAGGRGRGQGGQHHAALIQGTLVGNRVVISEVVKCQVGLEYLGRKGLAEGWRQFGWGETRLSTQPILGIPQYDLGFPRAPPGVIVEHGARRKS